MTPAEHQEAKELFGKVLDLEPHVRAQTLNEACAGRPMLRQEVESLLAAYQEAGTFIDAPLNADALLQDEGGTTANEALVGRTLGTYHVESIIGEGGMGVVYRALDSKLNRPVAIKFLSSELANASARRRFTREAQVASSLNHPHILTVHDAGEFEGRQYLVTELVDAGTLTDWARAEPRTWQQVVEVLVGVADGLATAHDADILHRDIKPANILITRSGYAKLADFGLAKLYERSKPVAIDIRTQPSTHAGGVVGTVGYMSPEQALGRALDARSDIFSFGVALYEVLAGRRPFTGASDIDVLHDVVHARAEALPVDVPLALRLVVEKALEKNPSDRYQSMRDLVVDLRHVLRQSAEAPVASAALIRVKRVRYSLAPVAALVAIALAAALSVPRLRPSVEPTSREYTPLTHFVDSATSPALSPDGRMLAFIRSEFTFGGPGEIYVKLLPDGEPVQLTHDGLSKRGSPKFSPDGMRIAYSALQPGSGWDTWVVPVLGGQPRFLLGNASGLTWIEAGPRVSRVLFSELTGRGGQMSLATSTESRADHRTVYMPPATGMAHRSALSPDRKQVLVVEMEKSAWLPCRLMPFDGSAPGKPVGPAPAGCTDAAWSPDGRWMYFAADAGNGSHIWRQRFPDGAPEQITFGVTQEEGIEVASDGRSLVTSIGASQSTVWFHDARGDRQITSEGYGLLPSVSPDAKKLYYLIRAGGERHFVSGELWVTDLESGQRQHLLPEFLLRHYAISADGQRVVFAVADDTGRSPVWLATLDGRSAPRQVTSTDGRKVYFGSGGYVIFTGGEQGTRFAYRVREDGSELQRIVRIDSGSFLFGASPDGQWVVIPGSSDVNQFPAMVLPVSGGSATPLCVACVSGNDVERVVPPGVSWSPDGAFIYLKFQGASYGIPLRPGQMLPPLPASGFRSEEEVASLPGAVRIPQPEAFPGPNPSIYAFTKLSTHRNIYRVPIP